MEYPHSYRPSVQIIFSYASVAFLWTVRKQFSTRQGVTSDIRPTRCESQCNPPSLCLTRQIATFAKRMRMISRIAISNFVIPTLFSIAQLVVIYNGVSTKIVNDIVLVNTMVTVFGVVFATVWVGKERKGDAEALNHNEQPMKIDPQKMSPHSPRTLGELDTWKAATSLSSWTSPENNKDAPRNVDERVLGR